LLSPIPGIFIAQTLIIPFALLITRVANAWP
jgi:hypothetical protein